MSETVGERRSVGARDRDRERRKGERDERDERRERRETGETRETRVGRATERGVKMCFQSLTKMLLFCSRGLSLFLSPSVSLSLCLSLAPAPPTLALLQFHPGLDQTRG